MENSLFQNPKTAIIRLLKSQGCCPCQQTKSSAQLQTMIKYREELNLKLSQQKQKLKQVPCVITLAQEIEELKQVVSGLSRQNKSRSEEFVKYKQQSNYNINIEVNERQEQAQHERLQYQYAFLLKNLQLTNENNRKLVERLTRGS